MPYSAQHAAGDDDLLDLGGALDQLQRTRVAVVALDGVVHDVAVAAVDLHHLVGHLGGHAAGEQLGHGRLLRERLALVDQPGRLPHQPLGRPRS